MDTNKRMFSNQLVMIGFGSVGQAVLPLLFKHLQLSPQQLIILSKDTHGEEVARTFNCSIRQVTITPENYESLLEETLHPGDFLLNLSVDISSLALINYCQNNQILYLDTSTEPWSGGYSDPKLAPAMRTNYALRDAVLALKKNELAPTAVLTHGANPGLASHFVKQALLNIAADNGMAPSIPDNSLEWATLGYQLGIKVIHVAERDTQISNRPREIREFVNTWSVDGFISEAGQPAELGWGTHEKHWPIDANRYDFGPNCAIYLTRPGGNTRVRTWTPTAGAFHGFLITHAESISLANYFTLMKENQVFYRPTVHYAYLPCPDATLSLEEHVGREWDELNENRLMLDDVICGMDELGVLLMGNEKGAYWYGSQMSIQEARQQVAFNNATSLQIAAGVLAGVIWAIKNPEQGIVEPEDMDFQAILQIAQPYLGRLGGYYTQWNPLQKRGTLFYEALDLSDPWQFLNIRVQ